MTTPQMPPPVLRTAEVNFSGQNQNLPPLTAVICQAKFSDGTPAYIAHCLELGIVSQGTSVEEARSMLQEAVELWLEVATPEELSLRLAEGGHAIALMVLPVGMGSQERVEERMAA